MNVALPLSIMLVTCTPALCVDDLNPDPRGIFSDLEYNEEAGDLIGTELFIIPAGIPGEYEVLVQVDEGTTGPVVLASAHVSGHHISIKIPGPSIGKGTFEGAVGKNALVGEWTYRSQSGSNTEKITLRRKHSYWDSSRAK